MNSYINTLMAIKFNENTIEKLSMLKNIELAIKKDKILLENPNRKIFNL